jgi:hypothetical protein
MTNAHPRKEGSCQICRRPSEDALCRYHREAFRRLVKHYKVWKERKGFTWKQYLEGMCANEMTGAWVREVAEYAIKEGVREPSEPGAETSC